MLRKSFAAAEALNSISDIVQTIDRKMVDDIAANLLSGKYYSIVGPPLTGKTAFLFDILRSLGTQDESCTTVYLDLAQNTAPDEQALYRQIAVKLAETWQNDIVSEIVEYSVPILRNLLLSYVKGNSAKIILAIDHVDVLSLEVRHQLLRLTRSIFGLRMSKVEFERITVILCGSFDIYASIEDPAAHFNISELVWRSDLTSPVAQHFIQAIADQSRIRFSHEAIAHIVNATSGDRYFIQRICSRCIETASLRKSIYVNARTVLEAIEFITSLHYDEDRCFGNLVRNLYSMDAKIIVSLDRILQDLNQIATLPGIECEKLRLIGILKRKGAAYQIRNDIFKQYLKRHHSLIRLGLGIHQRQMDNTERLLKLEQVAFHLASTLDSYPAQRRVLEELRQTMSAVDVFLFTYGQDGTFDIQASSSVSGLDVAHTQISVTPETAAGEAMKSRVPFICGIESEYCEKTGCHFRAKFPQCNCIWLPLVLGSRTLGLMEIVTNGTARATSDEIQRLRIIAALLASSVANGKFIKVLSTIASLEIPQDDSALGKIVAETQDLFNAPVVNLWTYDKKSQSYRIVESVGLPQAYRRKFRLSLNADATSKFVDRLRPLFLPDVQSAPRFIDKSAFQEMGLISLMSMPVHVGLEPVAIFEIATTEKWDPSAWEKDAFRILSNLIGIALANIQVMDNHLREDLERDEFIQLLSHQIPEAPVYALQVIDNLLLRKLGKLTKQQEDRLTKTQHQLTKHNNMITALRDLGRFEKKNIEIRRSRVDINRLIQDIAAKFSKLIKEKELKFSFTPTKHLPLALLDQKILSIAIENLIDNAVKFTPQSGRVQVRSSKSRAGISIRIDDTGPGVPKKYRNLIFTKYFQVEHPSQEQSSGIGLGLYFVQKYVAALGGHVACSNKPGRGARFTITIPT